VEAGEDAAHVGKAGDYAGHGIVGMDFVFEIDETFVLLGDQSFKYFADGHEAVTDGDLAVFRLEVREVLYVHVMQAGADFVDGLDDIGAGTNGVADVNAAADTRIQTLYGFQDIER
jgi:hypothetical protein